MKEEFFRWACDDFDGHKTTKIAKNYLFLHSNKPLNFEFLNLESLNLELWTAND